MVVVRVGVGVVGVRSVGVVRLRVWSGVVAGKVVYEGIGGVDAGGWFRVSPLYREDGVVVGEGVVLREGEGAVFRVAGWGEKGAGVLEVLERVGSWRSGELEAWLEGIDVFEVELPSPGVDAGGGARSIYYCFHHLPSFYRFRGSTVYYPSPERLVAYAARIASMAAGVDYRGLLARLRGELELVYWEGVFPHWVRLSHGKRQPTFTGHACYYTVLDEHRAEALYALLRLVSVTGVGGSPGLGLGWVENAYPLPPPFKSPGEPLYSA